jgi:hypothetical protein
MTERVKTTKDKIKPVIFNCNLIVKPFIIQVLLLP